MKGEKGLHGTHKCGHPITDNYGDSPSVALLHGPTPPTSAPFLLFLACGRLSSVVGYPKTKVQFFVADFMITKRLSCARHGPPYPPPSVVVRQTDGATA